MKTYAVYNIKNVPATLCCLCNKKKPLIKKINEQENPKEYCIKSINLSKNMLILGE